MELAPHQARVVEEKADLDAKIARLADFMIANPAYKDLPSAEKGRLYRQQTAMLAYSHVLGERIEAFES